MFFLSIWLNTSSSWKIISIKLSRFQINYTKYSYEMEISFVLKFSGSESEYDSEYESGDSSGSDDSRDSGVHSERYAYPAKEHT